MMAALPHFLGVSDESHFLYRAYGVLSGQVPYRDFFEFYTPLSFYLMALAFALFGTKLATAKFFMAILHALTVSLIFKASRRAGARRSIAITTAVLYLVMGPSAWPYASPHWIAAFLLVAIMLVLQSLPLERKSLIWLGLLTGLLGATQQQVAVPIAIGIGLSLCVEPFLDTWAGRSISLGHTVRRVLLFSATAVGLTLVVLLSLMTVTGPVPMIDQLIIFPLTGYRSNVQANWGHVGALTSWLAAFTFPAVHRMLAPSVIAISCVRLMIAFRAGDHDLFAMLTRQTIYLFFAVCAALYFPDFIHLAFISSVVLVVSAETMEWALSRIEAITSSPRLGLVVALPLIALAIVQLRFNSRELHQKFKFEEETRFGRVSFDSEKQRRLFRQVSHELDQSEDRLLFCYPVYTSLYLLAEGHNPTKHILMVPKYISSAHFDEAIETLEALRVRNVVLDPKLINLETDPMYAYIKRNYHCADGHKRCFLYRRNN
jgi:hypothetical protein